MSSTRAALRGTIVALLSYVVFIALFIVQSQLSDPSPVIGWVLLVVSIGSFTMFWPVALAGALAGWLLCRWSCQADPWDWLLNMPRITARAANLSINVAALIVLLNCAAGLLLMRVHP